MSRFSGDLIVRLLEDTEGGLWQLVAPLSFQSDVAGITVNVPAGFKTDFASVPRIPGVFDFLGDRARMAGTVHDFLYSSHITDRETADKILREMCLLDGLNEAESEMFYIAVRVGGEAHW